MTLFDDVSPNDIIRHLFDALDKEDRRSLDVIRKMEQ